MTTATEESTAEYQRTPLMDMEHGDLPDPVAETLRLVLAEQGGLEERVKILESTRRIACAEEES